MIPQTDDTGLQAFLDAKAASIRAHAKRAVDSIIAIGADLIAVKQRLPHGAFLPWIEREFAWSESAANKFMQVAQAFDKSVKITDLPGEIGVSALYALAAPSTPQPARDGVVDAARSGSRVNVDAVRAGIKAARDTRATQAATKTPPPVDLAAARAAKEQREAEQREAAKRAAQATAAAQASATAGAPKTTEAKPAPREQDDETMTRTTFPTPPPDDFIRTFGSAAGLLDGAVTHLLQMAALLRTEQPPRTIKSIQDTLGISDNLATKQVVPCFRLIATAHGVIEKAEAEQEARITERVRAQSKMIDDLRAQVERARGKIPRRLFRFMRAAVHPDRFDSDERKETAADVVRYLTEFETVLAMTEAEETERTARMEKDRAFRARAEEQARKERERQAEKTRKATSARSATRR